MVKTYRKCIHPDCSGNSRPYLMRTLRQHWRVKHGRQPNKREQKRLGLRNQKNSGLQEKEANSNQVPSNNALNVQARPLTFVPIDIPDLPQRQESAIIQTRSMKVKETRLRFSNYRQSLFQDKIKEPKLAIAQPKGSRQPTNALKSTSIGLARNPSQSKEMISFNTERHLNEGSNLRLREGNGSPTVTGNSTARVRQEQIEEYEPDWTLPSKIEEAPIEPIEIEQVTTKVDAATLTILHGIVDRRVPEDNALPEIKTKQELQTRHLISVNNIFWSVKRKQVICRLTSRQKTQSQLRLQDVFTVQDGLYKRRTLSIEPNVISEHYVRLDFLKTYAGEFVINYLTDFIRKEVKQGRI